MALLTIHVITVMATGHVTTLQHLALILEGVADGTGAIVATMVVEATGAVASTAVAEVAGAAKDPLIGVYWLHKSLLLK